MPTVVSVEVCSSSRFTLTLTGQGEFNNPLQVEALHELLDDLLGPDSLSELQQTGCCQLDADQYPDLQDAFNERKLPGVTWTPLPEWVVAALPSFGGDDDAAEDVPESYWLPEGLMPYQQISARRALAQRGRVLLADEMGLGKTAQALAVVGQYIEREGPVLIVVPSSLGAVWRDEAMRWLPGIRAHDIQMVMSSSERPLSNRKLIIVSYSQFTRSGKAFATSGNEHPWKMVICDEAHYLRNPTSQRCKMLLPVLQAAQRVVLVTGTPTPKMASEAYALVHALRPLRCTFKEWCSRYGKGQRTEHREAEVGALLAEVMIRRTKAEVMDELPEKSRQKIALQLSHSAMASLRRVEKSSDDEHFQQLASIKEAAAQDYVQYLLDASDAKFLVFGHHRNMLDSLQATISKYGADYIRIDGSTPAIERPGLVSRFQTVPSCRVAVLSIMAAGEGLTLTAASTCVFSELCPAVPGVIEQAEARVHRLGQKASRVDVHYLVVEGTRDGVVFDRLESRTGAVSRAIGSREDFPAPGSGVSAPSVTTKVIEDRVLQDKAAQEVLFARTPRATAPKRRKRQGLEGMLGDEISRAQGELKTPCLKDATTSGCEQPLVPRAKEAGRGEAKSAPRAPPAKRKSPAPAVVAEVAPVFDDDDDAMLHFFSGGL